ncbi:MAG: DUF349 domain-containing protein, partial [Rikenellaceae bacterium]
MENNVYENSVLKEQADATAHDNTNVTDTLDTVEKTKQDVDFSDEDAIMDAENSELDLGAESEEEQSAAVQTITSEDISGKTREELVALFEEFLATKSISAFRKDAELIKIAFYKAQRVAIEAQKKAFIDAGGVVEEFVTAPDGLETRLKELFAEYRSKRNNFLQKIESENENNLKIKLQIIEELKELTNNSETINQTFATFRELQNRWKESGIVPKANIKDLWETYHLHVENFYNFVKINKELRDLDLKKNYEAKVIICEEAEALLMEESIVIAFGKLQKLHDLWRETGPVAPEFKDQLWDRFKDVSSKINKKHQDHFDQIKQEQNSNLALKTGLCEKCEALLTAEYSSRKEWDDASKSLVEIQKVWKTIGFAPKRDNTKIYARFRTVCDNFFEKKREFFLSAKSEMENNLQRKIAICVQAEAISQSDDWKKGSSDLIALQKEWKEIGVVSRKHSDLVWKRFRAACDVFFERKSSHYVDIDGKYETNLAAKQAIIAEIKAYEAPSVDDGFTALKEFQRRWMEIGFVPIKEKEALQKEYRSLIDARFDALRGNESKRKIDRFKERVSSIKSSGNNRRVEGERERLTTKIKNLESDITLWENNIGFFSGSKNSQSLVADVNNKIQ